MKLSIRSRKIKKKQKNSKMEVYQKSLHNLKVPMRSTCNKFTFWIKPRVKNWLAKRRRQRAREYEAYPIVMKEISFANAQTWKHIKRHKHAKKRRRGFRGRFLSKAESDELDRKEAEEALNKQKVVEVSVKKIQPDIDQKLIKACELPNPDQIELISPCLKEKDFLLSPLINDLNTYIDEEMPPSPMQLDEKNSAIIFGTNYGAFQHKPWYLC